MMRDEIDAAVHFFGRVIIASNSTISHLGEFKSCLSKLLEKRFQNHWHEEVPGKGQGYRSIRMHPSEPLDPVLEQAALDSAFNYDNFFIPMEFTLWVDPKDVSCRFGDLKATYCTVLKDKDNKSNSIDVEELLETAKAVYTRQQHISIQHTNKQQVVQPSMVMDIYQYERNGQHYPSGSPPLYYDAFHHHHHHHPGSNFLLYGAAGDGFSTPPPPFTSPPSPPQFQPSFLSSAVNTTPRKGSGKGGNFRKSGGGGGSGTGRGSRHNHHHQQQHNGEGTTFNHNHNNNHNTNGSTPNGTNWNGDRYHWVKGSKQQQQQQQQSSGSGKEAK